MVWPLKLESNKRFLPKKGPGSFWENRKDRYHCGIDLYATEGTTVCSIADGIVIDAGVFTDASRCRYWNKTFYVLIAHDNNYLIKYAEMGSICVDVGDEVKNGMEIGKVGLVLNTQKINVKDPIYIQALALDNPSMLHVELYKKNALIEHDQYLGGNWFGSIKPNQLLNPYPLLRSFL